MKYSFLFTIVFSLLLVNTFQLNKRLRRHKRTKEDIYYFKCVNQKGKEVGKTLHLKANDLIKIEKEADEPTCLPGYLGNVKLRGLKFGIHAKDIYKTLIELKRSPEQKKLEPHIEFGINAKRSFFKDEQEELDDIRFKNLEVTMENLPEIQNGNAIYEADSNEGIHVELHLIVYEGSSSHSLMKKNEYAFLKKMTYIDTNGEKGILIELMPGATSTVDDFLGILEEDAEKKDDDKFLIKSKSFNFVPYYDNINHRLSFSNRKGYDYDFYFTRDKKVEKEDLFEICTKFFTSTKENPNEDDLKDLSNQYKRYFMA